MMPEKDSRDTEHAFSSEASSSKASPSDAASSEDTEALLSDIENVVSERKASLLEGVVSDLKQASPPLNHAFLVENGVTADECFDTSKIAGEIIDGFLKAPAKLQFQILVCASLSGEEENISPDVLVSMIDEIEMRKSVMRRLHRLNDEA